MKLNSSYTRYLISQHPKVASKVALNWISVKRRSFSRSSERHAVQVWHEFWSKYKAGVRIQGNALANHHPPARFAFSFRRAKGKKTGRGSARNHRRRSASWLHSVRIRHRFSRYRRGAARRPRSECSFHPGTDGKQMALFSNCVSA